MKTLAVLGITSSLLAASLAAQEPFYDPKGRRDPFVSPTSGSTGERPSCPGRDLAGKLVQELALRGIVRTEQGRVALLASVDGQTYFAREGTLLCDSRVLRIDAEAVVFVRPLGNPLAPEREVERRLFLHEPR